MLSTKQITLRTAVIIPFVMIFIITMGVIIAFQKQSYEAMVVDISNKQLSSITENVTLELNQYLQKPFQASLSLSHNVGYNHFYTPGNTHPIEQYLFASFSDLYTTIPQLDVIGFGGINGEYIGLRKEANKELTLMVKDDRTKGELIIFRGSQISKDVRSIFSNYDPRKRPWYVPVKHRR